MEPLDDFVPKIDLNKRILAHKIRIHIKGLGMNALKPYELNSFVYEGDFYQL